MVTNYLHENLVAQIQEYTVYSIFGVCSINKSCYDLKFYTEGQDQYFTSNFVFLFQNGEHYLGISLYFSECFQHYIERF